MTLALAAQRTERIGLGPGVLVPSLRHPIVNAAATATLCALAPRRVAVASPTWHPYPQATAQISQFGTRGAAVAPTANGDHIGGSARVLSDFSHHSA